MTGRIIRTDGTEEPCPGNLDIITERIAPRTGCLDTVRLRHLGFPTQVMVVDDTGFNDRLPVNAKATALYHANCIPGTTQPICGDVWVGDDNDFGEVES